MKSIIICASLLLGLAFQSCSKEVSLSKEDKLTSGLWNFDSYTSSNPSLTIEPCSFDNSIQFFKDGVVYFDEGDILCPDSDQNGQATWVFGDSDDILIITEDEFSIPITILSLSGSKLVIEQESPFLDGTMTVEYKH